ncbi:hypothetical protein [Bradyrhizobium sp.]
MTIKIKLSSLAVSPEEFARHVEIHAAKLLEYKTHLQGVAADAADPDLKPEERRVAFPPPSEERLVEHAAVEGYEFEGPTLDEKKAALFAEVRRLETEGLQAVIPPAKARHWQFREQDIRAADHNRLLAASDDDKKDPAKFIRGTRPVDDDRFMREHAARQDRSAAIQRHAAKHEHDIADLTEDTVDGYVIGGYVIGGAFA